MADKKISQLTAATTPLAGTEVLPIVQSGSTDQVSVANLTAGRAVSVGSLTSTGDISQAVGGETFKQTLSSGLVNTTLTSWGGSYTWNTIESNSTPHSIKFDSYGNIVPGTAAKGINFTANTPAAGKTSQLLNWYEEGTFTPALTFGGGSTGITYYEQSGAYTRVGRVVYVRGRIALTSKGSSTGTAAFSLPFAVGNYTNANGGAQLIYGANFVTVTSADLSSVGTVNASSAVLYTVTTGAQITDASFGNDTDFMFSFFYFV